MYEPPCESLARLTISEVSGDHTRIITIATPTVGGLMKFTVKTVTCLGCKTPLRANNSAASKTLFRLHVLCAMLMVFRRCGVPQLSAKDG